jgi:membrane protease YdiL (CAAX protease family)
MTPYDPESPVSSPESPATSTQPPVTPRVPFWNYQDLLFFLSLCFPSLLVAILIVRAFSGLLHLGKPFQGLLAQLVWYALVFSALYALLRVRYGQPFWRSLGWTLPVAAVAASFLAGPLLAIVLSLLGNVLRTPEIPLPFQQMLQDRPTIILFAIFVVILGPLCEELAFRGFLMPLLMRSFGPATGIIATGLLFGSLHGPEYGWHWQHALLISVAGMVFGWVRFRSGSTAAAAAMHSTYNLMQFAAFLAQNRTA